MNYLLLECHLFNFSPNFQKNDNQYRSSTVIKPLGNQQHILRLGSLAKETILQKISQSDQLKHFAIKYENKYMQIEENEEEIEKELDNFPILERKVPGSTWLIFEALFSKNQFIYCFKQINAFLELNLNLNESVIIDFGSELKNRIFIFMKQNRKSLSINYDAKKAVLIRKFNMMNIFSLYKINYIANLQKFYLCQ